MARRTPLILLALLLPALLLLTPASAAAHGFGQRYDLPVPLWLYLYGAAGTVALSFILVGFFVGEKGAAGSYRRYNLLRLRLFRTVLGSSPFLLTLRLIAVGLFLLVIATGLRGTANPVYNFAPTFVWIIWWVGLSYFTAFIGNVWDLLNPWRILFEWADELARRLGLEYGLGGYVEYPRGWGIWPATIFYFAFVWSELAFGGSPFPNSIATLTIVYSLLTWAGMLVFGKEAWLARGEAFTVFFGLLARFAPTELRVSDSELCRDCGGSCRDEPLQDGGCVNCYECFVWAQPEQRELNLRPPAVGLNRPERIGFDRLVFVAFMLSSVTFDGLEGTELWSGIEQSLFPLVAPFGDLSYVALRTLGLFVVPLLFLLLYLGFSYLIERFGGRRGQFLRVAGGFVYSLVPIALAYQFAHYFTLLVFQGQNIIALASDPYGWGWDLFGTADYRANLTIISAGFAWYAQVAAIVLGHVIAVYLAHAAALRWLGDQRLARRSQYPMLVLMVLYTMSSLWILSEPVVTESKTSSAPRRQEQQEVRVLPRQGWLAAPGKSPQ